MLVRRRQGWRCRDDCAYDIGAHLSRADWQGLEYFCPSRCVASWRMSKTELGRFGLLVADCETAALLVVIADDIKSATSVRSLPTSLREHVELKQDTLDTWIEVTNLARQSCWKRSRPHRRICVLTIHMEVEFHRRYMLVL